LAQLENGNEKLAPRYHQGPWLPPSDTVEQVIKLRLEDEADDPWPSVYRYDADSFGCEAFSVGEAHQIAAAGLFGTDYRLGCGVNEHAVHAAEAFIRECSAAYHKLNDRLKRIDSDPRLQVQWQRVDRRQ
jgi:hypothetical protein